MFLDGISFITALVFCMNLMHLFHSYFKRYRLFTMFTIFIHVFESALYCRGNLYIDRLSGNCWNVGRFLLSSKMVAVDSTVTCNRL